MKQRMDELENVQHPQNILETRSLPEMRRGGEWLPEYTYRLLFDINKKVDHMADKLQTIHEYVENTNAVLDLAQDEVEIIASDVEDIDEKVDDVKSAALPQLSDVVKAVNTVERVLTWGSVLLPLVIVLYKTWESAKRKDDSPKPKPKPKLKTKPKPANEKSLLEKLVLPKDDEDDMYTI